MGIILWIAVGLAVGAVATVAMPGPDPLGPAGRALLGSGGALIGGALYTIFGGGTLTGADLQGSITAAIGALIVLLAYRCIAMRAPE